MSDDFFDYVPEPAATERRSPWNEVPEEEQRAATDTARRAVQNHLMSAKFQGIFSAARAFQVAYQHSPFSEREQAALAALHHPIVAGNRQDERARDLEVYRTLIDEQDTESREAERREALERYRARASRETREFLADRDVVHRGA